MKFDDEGHGDGDLEMYAVVAVLFVAIILSGSILYLYLIGDGW